MASRNASVEHASARFVEPMLCLAVAELPEGPQWKYELKLDGYRAIGLSARGRVHLLSRNGKDFSRRFQPLACALEARALPISEPCPKPKRTVGRRAD